MFGFGKSKNEKKSKPENTIINSEPLVDHVGENIKELRQEYLTIRYWKWFIVFVFLGILGYVFALVGLGQLKWVDNSSSY